MQECIPLTPLRKLWLKKNRHYFSKLSECIFYWCQVLWDLPTVRRCWWNTGTIWGRSVTFGLRGKKVYNKGLLINAQKLTEATAPSLSSATPPWLWDDLMRGIHGGLSAVLTLTNTEALGMFSDASCSLPHWTRKRTQAGCTVITPFHR